MEQEIYKNLITKELSEGLSSDEAQLLQLWLEKDPKNKTIKNRLAKAWKHSDLYKSDIKVDQAADWKKVSSRLKKERKVIPLWKQPWVAAASVLLLLGMSWFALRDTSPQLLEYATKIGETKTINLPDGSIVTLNEDSQLAFSKTDTERLVHLKGEAFFEVSHDPNHPFSVDNRGTTTTVLGTKFNIDGRDKKATVVSLLEGKISFEAENSEKKILAPGETINYNFTTKTSQTTKSKNENEIAWKTKQLAFDNEKITTVIHTIEDYFDKRIELILDKEECRFTGTFDNPKYADIIEVFNFTYEMNYKAEKTKDIIHIKKCK